MRLENVLAIGTNVAVIVGLFLVVMELNQNTELARIEMINDGSLTENQVFMALLEQEPKDAIAKSFECPEKLVFADYVVLDSYLYSGMNLVYRNFELAKEGFYTEEDWKSEVDNYAHWYFSGEFGKVYWNEVGRHYFDAEFSQYVDSVLTRPGENFNSVWRKIVATLPSKEGLEPVISPVCLD